MYYYIPASVRGLPGRGLEQPGLVEGVPAVAGGIDELQGPFRPSPGWDSWSQTRHALPHPRLQPGLAEPSMSHRNQIFREGRGPLQRPRVRGKAGREWGRPTSTPLPTAEAAMGHYSILYIKQKDIYWGQILYHTSVWHY